jgi:chromosome segregation ATPase
MNPLRNSSHSHNGKPRSENGSVSEVERLRAENEQLRSLCLDLEQALQEATHKMPVAESELEERVRECELMVEQKSETIRQLHQEIQRSQAVVAELEGQLANHANSRPTYSGPAPREDELMSLAEDLERERRQLQEDEQTLMEQMREMEVSLARERAEMARQRNDLQRLQTEIRHELERLEKSGAVQNKLDQLRAKLHDATTRRGMAPATQAQNTVQQNHQEEEEEPAREQKQRKGGLFGRLFGG